jgi:hypothetical protein
MNATFPVPVVEHIDAVADIKSLFNPTNHIYFLEGPINYPTGTSIPLHFLFVKDTAGRSVIRDKLTHCARAWSDPFHIWANHAIRSGLKLESIKRMPSADLTPLYLEQVLQGLQTCYPRLEQWQVDDCDKWYQTLTQPNSGPLHWVDGGYFKKELQTPIIPVATPVPPVRLRVPNSRPYTNLHPYTHQAPIRGPIAAEMRKNNRDEQTHVLVGYVICYWHCLAT